MSTRGPRGSRHENSPSFLHPSAHIDPSLGSVRSTIAKRSRPFLFLSGTNIINSEHRAKAFGVDHPKLPCATPFLSILSTKRNTFCPSADTNHFYSLPFIHHSQIIIFLWFNPNPKTNCQGAGLTSQESENVWLITKSLREWWGLVLLEAWAASAALLMPQLPCKLGLEGWGKISKVDDDRRKWTLFELDPIFHTKLNTKHDIQFQKG